MNIPKVMSDRIALYSEKLSKYPKLQAMYQKCYPNTWETALEACDDGTYFVLTGDIPAMWLIFLWRMIGKWQG